MSQTLSAEGQRHLKAALLSLARYRGTTRLYGQGHDFAEAFASQFAQDIQKATEYGAFRLRLDPNNFWLGEEPMGRGDANAQLCLTLYDEGLRFVGFRPGVPQDECMRLAHLLILPWDRRPPEEDDLLALLWAADFKGIELLVVERFAEVLGEGGEAALREDLALGRKQGAQLGRLTGDSVMVEGLDIEELMLETQVVARQFRMKQDEAELYLKFRRQVDFKEDPRLQAHDGLFEIPKAQSAALKQEIEGLSGGQDTGLQHASWILFELVRTGREGRGQGRLGEMAARAAVELVEAARPKDAARFVRRTLSFRKEDFPGALAERNFLLGYGNLVGTLGERLAEAFSALGEPERQAPSLFTLLSPVHQEHQPSVRALLPHLQHVAHCLTVTDVLRMNRRLDFDLEAKALADADGPRAVLAMLALWREGAGRGREQAWRLVKSQDPRAREAALRLLRGERSDRLQSQITTSLGDEAAGVRIEALRHAALMGRKLLELLEARVKVEDLRDLEADEMRAWCTAYAVAGRSNAHTELGHMLLEERRETEFDLLIRAACAHALKVSRASQAASAVEKATRRWPQLTAMLEA